MAFVVVANWKARPGEEGRLLEIVRIVTERSRQEPGNLLYQAQVSAQDPARILIYEQYVDARAFEDHKASGHFQRYVLGQAVHLLESRDVSTWETVDA
jgi:quinol monooxygenase YgiN